MRDGLFMIIFLTIHISGVVMQSIIWRRAALLSGLALSASFQAVATVVTIGNDTFTQTSQYVADKELVPQIHVIGLYDGGSSASYSNDTGTYIPGTTVVNVEGTASGHVSLVLSSYEQTNWILTGAGVSSLTSVVINGYGPSQALGIDGAKVIDRSGQGNYFAACGINLPYNGNGCDTNELISGVEAYFGQSISSFTGLYSTSPVLGTVTSLTSPAAYQVNVNLSAVPEAGTVLLMALGMGGLALSGAQRRARLG
ncbi:MAG TPA: hypothetical protein VFW93_04740 [Aquabacterium sp.]|nr:hypothetical protein [Aquabacterium sp.]